MWTYKKEDIIEEVNLGGSYIEASGCYEVTIDELEAKKTKNGADQIVFKFKTDDGRGVTIFFVYSNKEGVPTDFKVRQLNQLCSLLKIMPDKVDEMKGKKVGIFLKADGLSKDGKYINWIIESFFDVKTKGTSSELIKKEGIGDTYKKAQEKYAKDTPPQKQVRNETSNITVIDDSDSSFPF